MKKIKKIASVVGLLVLALSLSYCSKDDECTVVQTGEVKVDPQIAVALKGERQALLSSLEQREVLKVDEYDEFHFVSKQGVKIDGYVGSLMYKKNGELVGFEEGDKIEITFIELYDKGTMALTNRPTMGIYPDFDINGDPMNYMGKDGRVKAIGYKAFIATGGEFYIDLRINGNVAVSYQMQMNVPYANTNGMQEDMVFWQGTVDKDDNLTFAEFPMTTEMNIVETDDQEGMYVINIMSQEEDIEQSIGWVNIDKYISYEGEKTPLFVKVPEGYSGKNSSVYISFKDQEGLAQLDVFYKHDSLGYVFTEHYGWLPVGYDVAIIFMTIDPKTKKVTYAVKETKIVKNQAIEIKSVELKTGTNQEVKDILNKLK